jgi:cell division protein FtsN
LWLLLGLTLGLFGAFLWHLWELRQQGLHHSAAHVAAVKPAAPAADAGDGAPEADEPRFDFYTLLPNQQVLPKKADADQRTPAAASAPEKEQPAGPSADQTPYVLQAGSFRSQGEADRRRAAVLMLGLPVKVQKVPVKADDVWYRVVVGPFRGKAAAQTARTNLRANGVDSMLLKQG